ncbi:hypothetical protein TNCV_1857411 [Trichonephila clavipes]|nr:hypothetical protein TNCV_1857411 [Trichonephila clavipes]
MGKETPFWCPLIAISGRGSRVVWVSDRGLPCHEFEPSTTKDPPCRAAMQTCFYSSHSGSITSLPTSPLSLHPHSLNRSGLLSRRGDENQGLSPH